jgi:nuclear pore complex protein Nup85
MVERDNINLAPPLIEAGKFGELVKAGQTISSALSPSDNSLVVFIKNAVRLLRILIILSQPFLSQDMPTADKNRTTDDEQPLYFASMNAIPSSERRLVCRNSVIDSISVIKSRSS